MSPTPSAQRTLGYEETLGVSATLVAPAQTSAPELSAADTLAAPSGSVLPGKTSAAPSAWRSTVLPRIAGDGAELELVVDSMTRYEPMKLLGKGGMGEVVLVRDQDIARTVALKRLLPELDDPALLARFVEEIRTVGRLEHPNIVPIHDVGVDELGRYFFVMKYVEGETLESIIEHLQRGDPEYVKRYQPEARINLFLGVLHALEFAHVNGFVHRDVKPANVMVGRYGEVVLMDWGISKAVGAKRDAAGQATGELTAGGDGERSRLFATRVGSLIGTPAYMAPEQARGENEKIDARSDLYSATVLFHELVSLRHCLHAKQTMEEMLHGAAHEEFGFVKLLGIHGDSGPPPAELLHFCLKGLAKDPANRFQSAAEMIFALEEILAGNVPVQCHVTFAKRAARQTGRWVDQRPYAVLLGLLGLAAAVVFSMVTLVKMAVH